MRFLRFGFTIAVVLEGFEKKLKRGGFGFCAHSAIGRVEVRLTSTSPPHTNSRAQIAQRPNIPLRNFNFTTKSCQHSNSFSLV